MNLVSDALHLLSSSKACFRTTTTVTTRLTKATIIVTRGLRSVSIALASKGGEVLTGFSRRKLLNLVSDSSTYKWQAEV